MADMGQKFLTGLPIAGAFFDSSEEDAMNAFLKGNKMWDSVTSPELAQLDPELYQYLGDYIPESVAASMISEDPKIKQAQMDALLKMGQLAEEGQSAEDKLAQAQARREAEGMAKSSTEAALQNAQARGVAGSGLEFALREAGAQAAADRQNMSNIAQQAQAAKMRAYGNQALGEMAGGIRQQDFGVNSANTGIINQFNQMNTQNRNLANQYNLANRQNIANQNVGLKNQAQQYNIGLPQQQWENDLRVMAGKQGALGQLADMYWKQGIANQNRRKAMGQAIGAGIGAFAGPGGAQAGGAIGGAAGGMF